LLHPDEQFITEPSYWINLKQTSDPGNYMRPSHWSIKVNNAVYELVSEIKYKRQLFEIYPSFRTYFTYLSRIINALWGTLLIFVIFHLAQNIQKGLGFIAASVACIFPSYVTHSHYVTPDTPLSLFVALSMLMLIKFLETGRTAYFVCLMLFLAWCIGEKYPGALMAFFAGIHIFLKSPKGIDPIFQNRWARTFILIVGTFLFLGISTPFLILNYDKVLIALTQESRSEHLGADGLGWGGNFWFYLKCFYNSSGIVFLGFVGLGIYKALSFDKQKVLILFYPLLFILILSKVPLHWERWALPYYILPIVLGSMGIKFLLHIVNLRFPKVISWIFITIAFLFSSTESLKSITYFLSKNNTLNLSLEYCKHHGITTSNTIYGSFTPFAPSGRFNFDFIKLFQDSSYLPERKFAIISSGSYQIILEQMSKNDLQYDFYKKLTNQNILAVFSPNIPQIRFLEKVKLCDLSRIIQNIDFLKLIWVDKMKYVTGDEIRIYEISKLHDME